MLCASGKKSECDISPPRPHSETKSKMQVNSEYGRRLVMKTRLRREITTSSCTSESRRTLFDELVTGSSTKARLF